MFCPINLINMNDPALLANIAQMAISQVNSSQQRKWNERQMEMQHQWDLEMWNKTNEYNSPTNQLKRLQDAGLNPLYYGLDGSSAQGMQNAQSLGYNIPNMSSFQNPIQAGLSAELTKSEIELKQAEKSKVESETSGNQLDNEFKQKTMQARVDAEELKNGLTKEQISKVNSERGQIDASIKKTIAETDNELLKSALIQAQSALTHIQAQQIVALLPYQQLLSSAQTDAQRASASYNLAQAMVQNGLLEKGYVEKTIESIVAQTYGSEQRGRAQDIANNIATGNWYGDDVIGKIGNTFISTMSTLGSIITGPISNIVSR